VTEESPDKYDVLLTSLAPGSRVAGYRLEARIGAGGMAVVFRARDEELRRLVALKILAPALAADAEFRERFVRESRAAAAVDDPHIIPVHAAGEADGVLYIAMRFVAGGDLRSLVMREGPLPPDRAAALLSPVAAALDAAHATGLVHRDVKPANILVDTCPGRPDHVYLSDFGLSKSTLSAVSLTRAGHFLGTPHYSAPEQISGGAVDGRTDQYALACVAFTLLTGALPFERDEPMAVLWAHLSGPLPSVTALRPDLQAAADEVIARALAKAPGERYGSCGEFAEALRGALGLASYEFAGSAQRESRTAQSPQVPAPARPMTAPPTKVPTETRDLAPVHAAAATPVGAPQAPDRPLRDARSLLSRIPRRATVAALAGLLVVAAVIVAVLVSPGTRHPLAAAGASSPTARRTGGGETRTGSGTEPASPHNTVATRGTSAQGFAVSPGPRLIDPGSVGLLSVSFSPDGKDLFTSDGYLWALPGLTYTAMPSSGSSQWAMFSPSGTTFAAVVSGSAGASVWDTGTHAAALLSDTDNTFALTAAYSPDGAGLAVGADSGKVYVWDVLRHTLITTLPAQGQPAVQSLAYSPDGKTLAVGKGDHTYLWDLASHDTVATLPGTIESLAFSPDGKTLAIGNELWNTTTHTRIATLSNARCGGVSRLAFSADSSELAIATGQLTCVWDVAARHLIGTVTDPKGAGATAVAFSRDGRLLATGDDNGSIYLWHVK
jgi:hypothetical protein